MQQYDPVWGVPIFSYYLVEIVTFGDFETPQEERIVYTSRSKQELLDVCKENGWALEGEWPTHYIDYRYFF